MGFFIIAIGFFLAFLAIVFIVEDLLGGNVSSSVGVLFCLATEILWFMGIIVFPIIDVSPFITFVWRWLKTPLF